MLDLKKKGKNFKTDKILRLRERDRDRERETERERQTERQTERYREREKKGKLANNIE